MFSTPILDRLERWLTIRIPWKFIGSAGYKDSIIRFERPQLSELKASLLRLKIFFFSEEIYRLIDERNRVYFSLPGAQTTSFLDWYNEEIEKKIKGIHEGLTFVNQELVLDESLKKAFDSALASSLEGWHASLERIFREQQLKHGEIPSEGTRGYGSHKPLLDGELKNLFKAIHIENFKNLDKRLFDRRYLDDSRKWRGNAPELVAFISVLTNAGWFKSSVPEKEIRRFFEALYQKNIVQQFKPSKREASIKYKPIFEGMLP